MHVGQVLQLFEFQVAERAAVDLLDVDAAGVVLFTGRGAFPHWCRRKGVAEQCACKSSVIERRQENAVLIALNLVLLPAMHV